MSSATLRTQLGRSLKKLRKARGLKQEDLFKFLGISQSQYSKIESGRASLTAEQFLQLVKRFNLSLADFLPQRESNEEALLQNALIRLGANHLREIPDITPSDKFESANEVISYALLTAPSARLITALGPVLVKNYNKVNFNLIEEKLGRSKLERRLGWLIDSIILSLDKRLGENPISRDLDFIYGRALKFFDRKRHIPEFYLTSSTTQEDDLDPDLTSSKTLESVKKKRDAIARKWGIVTRITSDDFYRAIKDSEID
jgi:transcriptional regulator with XRE-family HTH domain